MIIIIGILIVFFAVSGLIAARVITSKRNNQREIKEKEKDAQEKKRREKEHKKLEEKRRSKEEEERKELEEEHRRKRKEQGLKKEEIIKTGQEAKVNESSEEKERKEKRIKGEAKIPPENRGGRSRGQINKNEIEQRQPTKPRTLNPEVVCWEKGGEWITGIEIPEEFTSPQVSQNGELLEQDPSDATIYHLRHITGTIKVKWTEGEQDKGKEIPIIKDARNYLIFKMRKEWKGLGRVIRKPTTGCYLAIVPLEWERDEKLSGSAPIVPERVQINGYKAHFFSLITSENTSIAFTNPNGERMQVKSGGSVFKLIGKEISDLHEDVGPLFCEEPPQIKTFDEQGWDNVRVIVLGEEGSGRNRWRTQFSPQKGTIEQKIPDDLANRKGGWYFIRIYNNDDDLLESMDFRFSVGLKGIQIINPEYFPKANGYENVIVKFTHEANCKVEPEERQNHNILSIRNENNLTIITVPPKPYYDKTNWIITDGDAKTKVRILMERIWWSIGKIGVVPTDWLDKSVSLSRNDFTATTEKALWVKFPRKRWISKIEVGFDQSKSRTFNVQVEEIKIAVPLRDFCNAEEIENKKEEFSLKMWASPEETKTYEAVVLKIPAELQPILPQPSPDLYSEVKKPCGKRKGKGFSKREIIESGLTIKNIKELHIPYDRRRKSSHSWNIGRLKNLEARDSEYDE